VQQHVLTDNWWLKVSQKLCRNLEKSWHDFEVCLGKNRSMILGHNLKFFWKKKILARFWIMFSIVLCIEVKSWHDWRKSWHNLMGSKILFKYSFTHLLSKFGESHGNQRRKLLWHLDTKGCGSLGEVQTFKNFREPKEVALGKWLVPFGERFKRLGNTSKESLCEQFFLVILFSLLSLSCLFFDSIVILLYL